MYWQQNVEAKTACPGRNEKKRFASLRFCVSSLHRDHANLLCIVKRLFDARAETRAKDGDCGKYINLTFYSSVVEIITVPLKELMQ